MAVDKPYLPDADFGCSTERHSSRKVDPITVLAILKEFKNSFLGAYPNDGAANAASASEKINLAEGLLYWNTTSKNFRAYTIVSSVGSWVNYDTAAQEAKVTAIAKASEALNSANASAASATSAAADAVQTALDRVQTDLNHTATAADAATTTADRVQTGLDRTATAADASATAALATIATEQAEIATEQATNLLIATGGLGGAALIGMDDGASGVNYSTVQAYRNYLLANTGASQIGWRRTGTTTDQLLAAILEKNVVHPEDFGALATEDGGAASQSTAFAAALNSGRLVDCRGKSYVIGDMVDPTDGVAKGLINGNFVRALANQTNQNAMFNLINQPNIKVRNNSFDYGATENAGSNDDSSRFLITVGSNDATTSTWVRGIEVTNNRFTGGGNGTPLYARGTIGALIANNTIVDRVVAGSATNDAQNGIDYSYSRGAIVTGNFIDGLYYRVAGTLTRIYSRGIVAVETSNAVVSGNYITNVDQGIDFSGGISASLPEGNVGISCVGNVVSDVRSWGIKFANCARNSVCSGNTILNFGIGGIAISGQSSAGSWGTKPTSHLLIIGNYICNPSSYASYFACTGIWIIFRVAYPGYPSNIRVLNNTITDTTGGGRLLHGIAQDDGDGAHNVIAGAPYNEVSGNKISGQTGTPTKGCFPDGVCAVTGSSSQSIPNATWIAVAWNATTVDGERMHSNTVDPERVTPTVAGWYEINFSLYFSEHAAGNRQARILVAGGTIPGGGYSCVALSGANVGLTGRAIVYVPAGTVVRVEAFQNSGGALNILRPNSQFSVERKEQM